MESPSELERFLASQNVDGEVESEGEFTIAREQALRKIAEFQLPFAAAWAVKIVQCAVAWGTTSPIRVDLGVKEARFFFVAEDLNLDDVQTAFYDPQPQDRRYLNHLLHALWAVGLRENWAFQLSVPSDAESLVWDGNQLQRVSINEKHSCVYLAICFLSRESRLRWIAGAIKSGARNADLLKGMCDHCYTCPVPLTVDGRRVDSLYHCPSHGVNAVTFPITCGFPAGELEPIRVPPGTFEETSLLKDHASGRAPSNVDLHSMSLRRAFDKARRRLAEIELASAPFIVASHWRWSESGDQGSIMPHRQSSVLYWVADGVVVDVDRFDNSEGHCSVATFVDASDLDTDLTSFRLAQTLEKKRRLEAAKGLVVEELEGALDAESTLSDIAGGVQTRAYLLAGGLFAAGALTFLGSPLHGGGVMLVAFTTGVFGRRSAKKELEKLRSALRELKSGLLSSPK